MYGPLEEPNLPWNITLSGTRKARLFTQKPKATLTCWSGWTNVYKNPTPYQTSYPNSHSLIPFPHSTPSLMATTEDFTFPIFTDPFSCSIDSPPLWCLSPAASPDHPYHEETSKESSTEGEESDQEEESYKDCFPTEPINHLTPRKSFSSVEELGKLVRRNGNRNDKEEKMDMLWEDFNTEERLPRSHSSSRLDSETVSMGCVEALRMSKPNNGATAIFSPRKPGLVVVMKVLKRFFLLHNSHRSVNKHHSSYRQSVKGHGSHKSVKTGSWWLWRSLFDLFFSFIPLLMAMAETHLRSKTS